MSRLKKRSAARIADCKDRTGLSQLDSYPASGLARNFMVLMDGDCQMLTDEKIDNLQAAILPNYELSASLGSVAHQIAVEELKQIFQQAKLANAQASERDGARSKAVPLEPTEEMIEVMCAAGTSCEWPNDFGQEAIRIRRANARLAYKAMLAAAPNDAHLAKLTEVK